MATVYVKGIHGQQQTSQIVFYYEPHDIIEKGELTNEKIRTWAEAKYKAKYPVGHTNVIQIECNNVFEDFNKPKTADYTKTEFYSDREKVNNSRWHNKSTRVISDAELEAKGIKFKFQ